MIDFIKDNLILVVPNSIKENILLELNNKDDIYNIKIISLRQLIDKLTFTYDEKTIYYLMNKYNIKYEVATIYLDNLKYIENKKYNNKLDKLVEIKDELIKNDLLYFDENVDLFLKEKDIIVYGYDYINKFDLNCLKKINATIIKKKIKNYKHDVYEFNDIEDEVEYVANKIINLLDEGIDINKIKLSGISEEYYTIIRRIFKFYNIPINLNNTSSIYDTNIISDFIKLIKENDIDKTLDIIKNKYSLKNDKNNFIYNKLIEILNKYTFIDNYNEVLDMLINDFKSAKNKEEILNNSIEVIDLKNNIIDDDTYVFLLGFNQGEIPIIHKDEDYISDIYKKDTLLETTSEKNNIEKEIVSNIIKSIKNLTISYKLKSPFDTYFRSYLIDELDLNTIKNEKIDNNHSNQMNKLKLTNMLDEFIKYGVKDDKLDLLYSNYKDIKYRKFNNKFKGINKEKLPKYIKDNLILSYSSIDNYYRCSFRYYLDNILRLSKYEETFMIKIGNIFHEILSKCFNEDFNFEEEYKSVTKDLLTSNKNIFFIEKLKEELLFIIDTIKLQNKFSSFNEALYENKIYVNKEGNIKLTFMGIIDKILYKEENNNTYLVIIDYKTGNPNTNLNNAVYGIDMQLPVYLYLSNEKFNGAKVIGFYLQKILDSQIVKTSGKTLEKLKRDNLKLQGYSINNEELLSKFDFSYKDSEVIKSMKVGNNGFYAYSKTISEEEINKLIEITKNNINTAFDNILDCKFDINPKKIGDNLVGCQYCKYKDICYMKEEDIVNLKEYKNLEFLK